MNTKTIALIQGWIDFRTRLIVLVGLLLAAQAFSSLSGGLMPVLLNGAVTIATVILSLSLEPLFALVGNLCCFAGFIYVESNVLNTWNLYSTGHHLVQFGSLMLLGYVAGTLGSDVRNIGKLKPDSPTIEVTRRTDIGLLDRTVGEIRLEEEFARAKQMGDCLSVVCLGLTFLETEQPNPVNRHSLYRVLARTLESMLEMFEFPFVTENNEIFVLLPRTTNVSAITRMASINEALKRASFLHPGFASRQSFDEYAVLKFAIVAYPGEATCYQDLLTLSASKLTNHQRPNLEIVPAGELPISLRVVPQHIRKTSVTAASRDLAESNAS